MSAEPAAASSDDRDPLQVSLGTRVRRLRARRGMTRRQLAQGADVSERHLANLEAGVGNPSVLVLRQVAVALDCPLAELLGDETTDSPDWLLIRDLLHGRPPEELAKARKALIELFGDTTSPASRLRRIALVGLRGAGKSTLAKRLAEELGRPFVELSEEVQKLAGCRPDEIHAVFGANAYRRYERRALESVLDTHREVVIATPGGIVSEAATFNLLLSRCYTIWLRAKPEDHMGRVVAQGDFRPMSGNREAMDDLKLILAERTPFYAKADVAFETSGQALPEAFDGLRDLVRKALAAVSKEEAAFDRLA
jgi:XRE family aerobic/anaerobic benzoate catabolism transcriptional regulator